MGGGASPEEPAFRAFGVFDGHGGKQAAAHCAKHLVAELGRGLASLAVEAGKEDPPHMEAAVPALLTQLFVETDRAWCEEQRPSGTTATVAVLSGWEVVVASVGARTWSCALIRDRRASTCGRPPCLCLGCKPVYDTRCQASEVDSR